MSAPGKYDTASGDVYAGIDLSTDGESGRRPTALVQVVQDPPGFLAELTRRLVRVAEASECPVEIRDLVGCFPHSSAFVRGECIPAGGAGGTLLVLKLTQPGRELLAALRALQGDVDFVADTRHDASPSVGSLTAPTVAESPAGTQSAGGEGEERDE